jgi:hypothetical protein
MATVGMKFIGQRAKLPIARPHLEIALDIGMQRGPPCLSVLPGRIVPVLQ